MPSPRWPSLALDPTNDDDCPDEPFDEGCDACANQGHIECPKCAGGRIDDAPCNTCGSTGSLPCQNC